VQIIYTSMEAKGQHMAKLARHPDIWIDDKPHRVFR
jgi:hypothetical protein